MSTSERGFDMSTTRVFFGSLALLALCAGQAAALKVVATTSDLGYFAREIGGSKATVTVICPGSVNPHFLETKPSHVRATAEADLFLEVGLALDLWAAPVRRAANNPRLRVVTCSRGCTILEKPKGPVDPSQGHLHPQGNPHIWLHPRNAMQICSNILAGYKAAMPSASDYFTRRTRSLLERIKTASAEWQAKLAGHKGAGYISYHPSYEYLADFLGLRKVATIEPKPGVPPSSGRVTEVVRIAKAEHVRVILQEVYYPAGAARSVAEATGAKLLILPTLTGGAAGTDTWFDLMSYNVNKLAEALK